MSIVDRVTALALMVAVLAALVVKVAPILSISPAIAMVAFGVYFATGGKVGGLIKALASLLAGAVWPLLANMLVLTHESVLGPYRWVLFGIVALLVVLQSKIGVLSCLPAGLCGAAMALHASALRPDGVLVGTALIVGALAGFVADSTAAMVAKQA